MKIKKPGIFSIIFILIFILGVLAIIAYINESLNTKTELTPFMPSQNSAKARFSLQE